MEFASEIKVGSVFTRTDRNGKVWKAVVTKRTPYFVEVDVHKPYPEKIYGSKGDYVYVDHIEEHPVFHRGRIQICEIVEKVKTGKKVMKNCLFFGDRLVDEEIDVKKGYSIYLVDRKSKTSAIDEKNTNYRCVSKYEWRF